MTSERIGSLTILTACMFAFAHYLQHGIWIFPFGLYKIGLLIAMILMFVVDKQKLKLTEWLALGWSSALLLTSKFFLEFFISEQHMPRFRHSLFVDCMYILFCLLFVTWAVIVSLKTQQKIAKIIGVVLAVSIATCFLLNLYIWAVIPLIGWLFCIFQEKDRSPVHFNIITLFSFLYITAWISGAYMGGINVLANM